MNRAKITGLILASLAINFVLCALFATCFFSGPVSAAPFQHWIAISNTAMSITGDVQFSSSSIIFVNHSELKLTFAGNATGLTWFDSMRDQPAQLYKIAGQKNPRLLNGNYLCGFHTTPSFLGVVEHDNDVYLTAFSGEGLPSPKDYQSRICAGFSYSLK
jgi:hypothetical protein